ncbi:MAG: DUF4412 domain-containing protein [Gammaproteobacteria bacterium]|nr:DUF4412 domain-containing protein [Gammaproteobacteria bacterium]
MLKTRLIALSLTLILPVSAFAAAMIESRDGRGETTRIYVQGDKARIEMPRQEGFMVMDVKNKTMKVVMHKERTVLDMSDLLKDDGGATTQDQGRYVDAYTKSKGLGPRLAGYETEEYEIYADNNYCGSVFVSVRALNDIGLRKFAAAFQNMADQVQKKITGMTGMQVEQYMDPCNQAEQKLSDQLQDIGFPLKSVDARKRLESVVTRIDRNARLPANAFVIPANYQHTNPTKMMHDATQQMKQMQPQMQEMMKNMPPEMRDMMRQQMQQYQ